MQIKEVAADTDLPFTLAGAAEGRVTATGGDAIL